MTVEDILRHLAGGQLLRVKIVNNHHPHCRMGLYGPRTSHRRRSWHPHLSQAQAGDRE